MNTFGNVLRLTTFGESHGPALGGVLDGMPAGVPVDLDLLRQELRRRKPGQSSLTTGRKEDDEVEILSGVFEGYTLGTPIGFLVRNRDQHSRDYDNLRDIYRPSHADYTYMQKYGRRDHRGGGRSSARETVSRVVGGAFAKMALRPLGIGIRAFTSRVGDIALPEAYTAYDLALAESNDVRCPDPATAARMEALIREVKQAGDTIGGIVTCVVSGLPAGLGEPVFGKLHAALAAAMMGINAAKGFDYGIGFEGLNSRGSEVNDPFEPLAGPACGEAVLPALHTRTNRSGGIQGGISMGGGADVYFRVAFKPVATLLQPQETVDCHGRAASLQVHGRHDPCVLPRAVPIVESMAALTVLDYYLLNNISKC